MLVMLDTGIGSWKPALVNGILELDHSMPVGNRDPVVCSKWNGDNLWPLAALQLLILYLL